MNICTDFFSMHSPHIFKIYSASHIISLLIIVLVIVSSFFLIKRKSERNRQLFKIILGWCALITQIIYTIWICKNGVFSIKDSLPLNICSVSLILVFLSVIVRKKVVINLLYFWGLPGTVYALLFPNLIFGFPHFRFFEFFIAHAIILWMVLYYLIIEKLDISNSDMIVSYVLTIGYLSAIIFLNEILRSNYLYLRRKPVFESFFDLLGSNYQIKLFCGLFFLFKILQIPFVLKKFKRIQTGLNNKKS